MPTVILYDDFIYIKKTHVYLYISRDIFVDFILRLRYIDNTCNAIQLYLKKNRSSLRIVGVCNMYYYVVLF